MNTDYNALLKEVKELNDERRWEECRELANVLSDVSNGTEPNSTICTVIPPTACPGDWMVCSCRMKTGQFILRVVSYLVL